jgi:dihydrolipoamide dehydrogenase
MTLITGTTVDKIDVREDGVTATLSNGKTVQTDKVLVSIGRAFNTDNIGLDAAGVQTGRRGEILVNAKMETSQQDGVYAIGDCVGGIMLAHVASSEGIVAVENALGGNCQMNYNVVPYGIFTIPELGCVGLTEKEAQDKGFAVQVGRFQYRGLGKAHAMGEITGMVKIVADKGTDKILGAHIIGAHSSDMIHELAVAMQHGLTVMDIAHTIHSHPTLSEAILEAAEDVHGRAVHSPKK